MCGEEAMLTSADALKSGARSDVALLRLPVPDVLTYLRKMRDHGWVSVRSKARYPEQDGSAEIGTYYYLTVHGKKRFKIDAR